VIGWKRKWSTVNREFCEDGEVVRWMFSAIDLMNLKQV